MSCPECSVKFRRPFRLTIVIKILVYEGTVRLRHFVNNLNQSVAPMLVNSGDMRVGAFVGDIYYI